jgi:transcriptional regulator with XRE-family HTH domain
MATFAERLQSLREAKGLSQYALAKRSGLSKQALSRLELGDREPSWGTVQVLAAALGVSCEAFATPVQLPTYEPRGPGRPPKPETRLASPKKPRGRPRKVETPPLPAANGPEATPKRKAASGGRRAKGK